METRLTLSTDTTLRRMADADGRAYFEKDVLAVGTWTGSNCPTWTVTLSTLQDLVANFNRAKAAGAEFPVNYDHEPGARHKAGEIETVWIDGDRLMARLWIGKSDDAEHLALNQPKVSIEVDRPWKDGHGNEYAQCLTAVAICNKPVYQGQGPFHRITLSLNSGSNPVKRKFKLANGDVVEGEPVASGPADDATEIAVTEVVSMLSKYFDVKLPADVDTAKELRLVLETMMAGSETDEPPAPEVVDAMPVDQMAPAMMKLAIATYRKREAEHKKREAATLKLSLAKARDAYDAEITEAIKLGAITEADRDDLLNAGEQAGYSLTLLKPLKLSLSNGSANSNTSKTRRLSNGTEPPVPGGSGPHADGEVKGFKNVGKPAAF